MSTGTPYGRTASGLLPALLLGSGLLISTAPLDGLAQDAPPARSSEVSKEKNEAETERKDAPPLTVREKAVWSLVGIASVTAITGGIFGLNALDEKNRYDNDEAASNEFKERYESRAIVSAVSLGVAGAATIAALIVGLVGGHGEPASVTARPAGTGLRLTF